jgi:L-lactate dehydrogenase complex protein LldF
VRIDIPGILVHLRAKAVAATRPPGERAVFALVAAAFGGRRRFALAQRLGRIAQRPLARDGRIRSLPGPLRAWTGTRDLAPLAPRSFRTWWRSR